MLVDKLNEMQIHEKHPQWKQINKEIIQEAATQLNLDPNHIRYMFQTMQINVLDDILSSLYLNIKSGQNVRKTVHDVIRSFAVKGYVVIVGRAAAAITHSCVNSLHIRLQAPIEWRVRQVMASRGISEDQAKKIAMEMDRKRTLMMEAFTGEKFDIHIFDMIFNCHTLSIEEITQSILDMMKVKKMI